jgi:hypothetical protein
MFEQQNKSVIDSAVFKGAVEISAILRDGSRRLLWKDHNILTIGFIQSLMFFLSGQPGTMTGTGSRTVATGTARWPTYMKVGTSTIIPTKLDSDILSPIPSPLAPSEDFKMPITSYSFGINNDSVTFYSVIDGGLEDYSYNTSPLSEVGLFTEADILVARQVYPTISKSFIFQLQYAWTIAFRS